MRELNLFLKSGTRCSRPSRASFTRGMLRVIGLTVLAAAMAAACCWMKAVAWTSCREECCGKRACGILCRFC